MAGKTGIQWTAADDGTPGMTWNPVVGCKRVSAGCDHCYAFDLHDKRHIAWKRGRWDSAPVQYHQPFSTVQLMPARLADPLHWRMPKRVFVNSMSDLFHESVPEEFIWRVWEVMLRTPQHTYQILTKRPERMRDLLTRREPLPNVWLGVSVENQQTADERIPLLLQTPAAVRFLSCEPLLGPVDIERYLVKSRPYAPAFGCDAQAVAPHDAPRLHWVIIGGESGSHARPMDLEWARSLIRQCRSPMVSAFVSPFVKQLGTVWAREHHAHDHHGGDLSEWPVDLRIREFPANTKGWLVVKGYEQ